MPFACPLAAPPKPDAILCVHQRSPSSTRILRSTGHLGLCPPGLRQPLRRADIRCTGLIASHKLGAIEVPSGKGCELTGDQVNGNIKIDPGAALSLGASTASAANTISGSITGTGIQSFDSYLPSSTIYGGLTLTGVANVPSNGPLVPIDFGIWFDNVNYLDGLHIGGATTITGSSVNAPWTDSNPSRFNGPFTYTSNAGGLDLEDDVIGGGMTVRGNTGGGTLDGLKIGGALTCGNAPPFTVTALSVSGHNGSTGGAC